MTNNFIYNKRLWIVVLLVAAFVLPYLRNCMPEQPASTTTTMGTPVPPKPAVQAPAFNADSAFHFVKKQVDFGPRVPGTPAHKKCAAWITAEFRRFGMTVVEQKFTAQTYFGPLDAVNIIAQYKPERTNRVLLCAHWDSRHVADSDTKNKEKPILGADDGGSGAGVLLEIARLLQANPVDVGVDLICFDAEDLGDSRDSEPDQSIMAQGATRQKKKPGAWAPNSGRATCTSPTTPRNLAFCSIWLAPAALFFRAKVTLPPMRRVFKTKSGALRRN
ncbi:MAG: M28 family peptidase [Saprospirales bacterium]|nr:M28 family peptidase [Saprospirales bacterium]